MSKLILIVLCLASICQAKVWNIWAGTEVYFDTVVHCSDPNSNIDLNFTESPANMKLYVTETDPNTLEKRCVGKWKTTLEDVGYHKATLESKVSTTEDSQILGTSPTITRTWEMNVISISMYPSDLKAIKDAADEILRIINSYEPVETSE